MSIEPAPRGNAGGDLLAAGATPADTRERIVLAAYRVIARKGYAESSVKEIAREAGVAPGLVHYYFDTKEQLLIEVVQELCRRNEAAVLATPLPENPMERALFQMRAARERMREAPDWYRLLVDMDALALRDPKLATEVARLKREAREQISQSVDVLVAGLGRGIGVSHQGLAAVLMGAFNGLAIQALIDPGFDAEAAYAALERMTLNLLVHGADGSAGESPEKQPEDG
jgi:AcrR family transcriptional regulator